MHRNTLLLVSILAVCAALLVGVNIGRRLTKQAPLATAVQTPTPTPGQSMQTYMDTYCGFSLTYPASFTILENASGSAILHNTADKTQSITLTCQKAIPRPALPADKIETLTIPTASGATIAATLYHDSSARDGTPIDEVIFKHPTKGMDGFVAGYGTTFNAAIQTLQILP
jgi:hypothetical protein